MTATLRPAIIALLLTGVFAGAGVAPSAAQNAPPPVQAAPPPPGEPPTGSVGQPSQPQPVNQYSSNELIDAGHRFFGGVSRGLAEIVQKAISNWGLPNGYVLG